jgi:hypothetical protein
MTLEQFLGTLDATDPPAGLAKPLLALWHDRRGDWDAAHRVAQEVDDRTGAWVHAYLHRKEGDLGNATYWYNRAGQAVASVPLDDEWRQIVTTLLSGHRNRPR